MSSNQYLFNRAWSVSIGLSIIAGSNTNASSGTSKVYSSFSVDGKQLPSPLRITFDIDKRNDLVANKAKIEIYNLSSLSRLQYQQADPTKPTNGYQIILQAGYSSLDNNPSLVRTIYAGDIRRATNKRTGADIITTFECAEGEKSLLLTTFDRSFPAGTTYLQVLQAIATQLGIPFGACVGIKNFTYNTGVTFTGTVKSNLNTLTTAFGLEASVQNNALQIKPVGSTIGTEAVILSNQTNSVGGIYNADAPGLTGLIGVPSQNQGITQFSSLLNPAIYPGTLVQLFSENITGNYFQVRRANFIGDSHGNKWQVDCEGVPNNNPKQVLTPNMGNTLVEDNDE